MKLSYKKIIFAALLLVILAGGLIFFWRKNSGHRSFGKGEEKIGWVSDIHADRFKKRDVDSGLLYPKKYKEYLPKVFDAMRDEGITTVIATGDNTNSGDDNYARDIKRIAEEKKMDVIWVRGNHDNDEVMSILGVFGGNYYYRDMENVRVIVLNTTQYPNGEYDYFGGINAEQMAWIEESLKTDKKVIVAMHMPMFNEDKLLEKYASLEKLFRESGNVKMVLAGHYHVPWQKEYNGIKYYIEGALTRAGEEGAYATINLEDFEGNYKFVK